MRIATRFTILCVLLLALCALGFAQDPSAASIISGATPDYGSKTPVNITTPGGFPVANSSLVIDENGAVVSGAPQGNAGVNNQAGVQTGNDDNLVNGPKRPNNPTIVGLDTVATFDGAFSAQAGPSSTTTRLFRWSMIGNDPRTGDTTVIPAKIDQITLQLLNADGSVFKNVAYDPFQTLTLESPNFEPQDYRTGHNIQYADAVHRAQFFNIMARDWHTVLVPHIVNKVTITVPFFVNVQLSNGNVVQARSYFTTTGTDNNTVVFMLNALFNFFFDNEVVNEINLGNFTTNSLNMTLWPNTFLFSLNVNNPNLPGGCCTLGFHTFFFSPGSEPQSRWVTQYASWISPGIFGGGFQDVTALSHETSEAFADPFLDNATPSWQFPGQPANSKFCQGNLEEGDPIEVLPNATAAIEVRERHFDFIYHPQNIPLLQWFEMGAKSDAIDGAFSFPDETVLTHSAIPCPQ